MTQEHKYLQVEITRTQGTLVFIKVPKDFNYRACANFQEILIAAAVETCSECDWIDSSADQWKDTVEWQAIKEVPQLEAEAYKMYEVSTKNPVHSREPDVCGVRETTHWRCVHGRGGCVRHDG